MADLRIVSASEARELFSGYSNRISHVSFDGLDLSSLANDRFTWITQCSFVGTDLRQSSLGGARFWTCDFSGADLAGSDLRDTSWTGCRLLGATFRDTDLRNAEVGTAGPGWTTDIDGADFTGSRLDGAEIRHVTGAAIGLP